VADAPAGGEPLPEGVPVVLDGGVRTAQGGRMLIGGAPVRVVRLSAAGARAVGRWRAGAAPAGAAERALARRLVDGGLAHPLPPPAAPPSGEADIVVPVRDRTRALGPLLAAVRADLPDVGVLVVDDASADRAGTARVAAEHGARLVRRESCGGPAAARNTGLAACRSPFVAFLDSDCVPDPGWLRRLLGHFADPGVGAAAPRILPARDGSGGVLARFEAARSPLDMGPAPARVAPGGPVSYVPSAALVVRRAACPGGFDPDMPVGEDVDLVWRLADAGWAVRYEPAAAVRHAHRTRLGPLLRRRFDYGTSAGPLALRHGARVAPAVVSPWSGAAIALAAAGRPVGAAAVLAAAAALLVRRTGRAGPAVPAAEAARLVGLGTLGTARWLAASVARAWWPAALPAALASRRAAALLAAAALAPPLAEWADRRPPLDPLTWTALCLAADGAYAAGVWTGAAAARTPIPLLPVLSPARSAVH